MGAYLADGLANIFGSGSFFLPVITAVLGWTLIRGRQVQNWSLIIGSGVLFLIGLCSLLAIQFTVDPFFGKAVQVGGLIGYGLSRFLITWLNSSGAVLILITLLFISFMVMTRLEVNVLVETLGKFFSMIGGGLWLGLNKIKDLAKKMLWGMVKAFQGVKVIFKKNQVAGTESMQTKKVARDPLIVTRTRPEPVVIERQD